MPTSTDETPTTDPPELADPRAPRPLVRSEPTERSAGFRRPLESTRIVQWEADARTWIFTYVGPQAARQLHPEDRERVLAEVEREVVELRRRVRVVTLTGQNTGVWSGRGCGY